MTELYSQVVAHQPNGQKNLLMSFKGSKVLKVNLGGMLADHVIDLEVCLWPPDD